MRIFISIVVVLLSAANAQSETKQPRLKGPARLDAMRGARTAPFDNTLLLKVPQPIVYWLACTTSWVRPNLT